jgi:hypothetical protein
MTTGSGSKDDPIRTGRLGIGFLLSFTARALSHEFDRALRPHGLDHFRLIIIRNVVRDYADQPGGVPVTSLAEKLVIPEATLREGARVLGSAGWLTVTEQRGSMLLAPTHKATSMLPVLLDAARWTHEQALNGFSNEEVVVLSSDLRRVMKNLGFEPPKSD